MWAFLGAVWFATVGSQPDTCLAGSLTAPLTEEPEIGQTDSILVGKIEMYGRYVEECPAPRLKPEKGKTWSKVFSLHSGTKDDPIPAADVRPKDVLKALAFDGNPWWGVPQRGETGPEYSYTRVDFYVATVVRKPGKYYLGCKDSRTSKFEAWATADLAPGSLTDLGRIVVAPLERLLVGSGSQGGVQIVQFGPAPGYTLMQYHWRPEQDGGADAFAQRYAELSARYSRKRVTLSGTRDGDFLW
jgi:hypothetical protein